MLIAAPTPLLRSLVTTCAEHGLPILCEKPCGFTTEEIDAAAAAARRAGVLLQIGYWRRYVPELVALRGHLQRGDLGELLQITCSQWDGEPPSMSFRQSSGGITIDMGVHELDQVRWLTGLDLEPAAAVLAAKADCRRRGLRDQPLRARRRRGRRRLPGALFPTWRLRVGRGDGHGGLCARRCAVGSTGQDVAPGTESAGGGLRTQRA